LDLAVRSWKCLEPAVRYRKGIGSYCEKYTIRKYRVLQSDTENITVFTAIKTGIVLDPADKYRKYL
jgi:hypothetical protein